MIEIYLKTNTNYDKNGDITLEPTSCIYKDSEKEVTLEHFFDDEGRWKYIEFENVIAAEENGKKKLYRIYNVVRSLYSVTAYARPLFYDLLDKILLDLRPTKKLGQEALNIILADTPFIGHSNITKIGTAYYIKKNIVEALLGDDKNSFLNRWGGEFYCENFDVYINDRIGSDNGVRVEFGYNLNEIEEDVNIENVVTRIIPVGFNGITLEGDTPWIDSSLINKYTRPKMRVIEFSDVKVKESLEDEEGFDTIEEARTELINRCNKLFGEGIDKPTVNYKIDMINLANTTAYKDLKMLVEVNKGDTVTCYIKHLDIDVKARVIDYERDLITGEYTYIELGSVVDNFFNNQADIQNRVDNIFNSNGNVKAETLEGAINALQAQFKALRDIAQPQEVRAILFEDRIEDSPTFGCMCLGTMGFEIASSFKPGTNEWDFRTFGTGKGFVADHIITGILNAALIKAGILKSENEITWIDMEDGTFNFADKVKFDGANFDIDLSGKDLATNTSVDTKFEINNKGINETIKNTKEGLETEIKKNAEAITQKVSNSDFNSYKNQTANEISQKVSNGDFGTLFKQTAYGFDFIGKITTKSDNYKLELNANKLIGFRGSETHNPMYSAGVWWPNGAPAGYVSVSKGNAETVDTNGALWMTAYPNDNDKAAGIQYMKKHNDGTYVGSIIEFSEAGSISLVSQKTTGAARYGLWSHPDGYIYPYQGDEQLGSNIKPWNKMYCNNLYYKNYSTPFSNSTLAESYQVTALNEEVSRTLVTSEVEKYKDDNSFYTFYKDKFESLVYTDGGNKDRLVVNPNSMLNDPIASILVSKDGDELLLDNNSYITSLTMALKRSIEKIEKLEDRIKVLEGGV